MVAVFFFFKQKTAYEMRISDWSSDVCSSDLHVARGGIESAVGEHGLPGERAIPVRLGSEAVLEGDRLGALPESRHLVARAIAIVGMFEPFGGPPDDLVARPAEHPLPRGVGARNSTRLNSRHKGADRMPSYACTTK